MPQGVLNGAALVNSTLGYDHIILLYSYVYI